MEQAQTMKLAWRQGFCASRVRLAVLIVVTTRSKLRNWWWIRDGSLSVAGGANNGDKCEEVLGVNSQCCEKTGRRRRGSPNIEGRAALMQPMEPNISHHGG